MERVMKMVKRMSPRKKMREGGRGGPGELESPDTLCDELWRFNLCISGKSSSSCDDLLGRDEVTSVLSI